MKLYPVLFVFIIGLQGYGQTKQVDSLKTKVRHNMGSVSLKVDSLKQLPVNAREYLNIKKDSIASKGKRLQQRLTAKPDSIKNKINDLGAIPGQKLDQVTNKLEQLDQLPDQGLGDLKTIGADLPLSNPIDKMDLPTIEPIAIAMPSLDIPGFELPQELPGLDQFERLKQYGGKVNALTDGLKELKTDPGKLSKKAEKEVIKSIPELKKIEAYNAKVDKLMSMGQEQKDEYLNYADRDKLKEAAREKAAKELSNFLAGHSKELDAAKNTMSLMKKKYASIADSRDMSTAIKKNSLKNRPFKKRLIIGTYLQLLRGEPMSVDLAPYVGYRLNRLFSASLAFNYRVKLGIENKATNPIAQDVMGGSFVLSHKIYKGITLYAEAQYLSLRPELIDGNDKSRHWKMGLPIGLDQHVGISRRFKAHVVVTYDFRHNEFSPGSNPWNTKVGLEIKGRQRRSK